MDPNQFSSLAVFISAAVAVAAIISPVVTNYFNNRHQLKLKKLELYALETKEQRDLLSRVFENYLSATGKLISTGDARHLQNYGEAYGSVLLYLEEVETVYVENCDDLIQASNFNEAEKYIRDVAEVLRKRVQQPTASEK